VVEACIEIRKKYKTKLPDTIIAATAIVYDLNLISHNVPDFKNIDGLMVIDPHRISEY
jgi:predicted nucleic acid-binding protein